MEDLMRKYLPMAFFLFAWIAAAQQQQSPPFSPPDNVEINRDVVYSTPAGRELHLDLFLPKSGAGPFPAVVYIHGGGWSGGNKSAFQRQAAYMASKGFVGACIQYRLSGEATYPAAVHDSKAAVRWLRANAAKYRIDPDRIGAAGGSAGGHLVAFLGATGDVKPFEGGGGNPGFSTKVRAVAAFNPVTDMTFAGAIEKAGGAENAVSRFLGVSYAEHPEIYAQASPITHVSRNSAAFLFLHGTADTTVPYSQSAEMMKKLKEAGVHADIFSAEGAKHGFFNTPPWYEPALKKMEEFFTKFLK
jgi:acetyl esterase/lipase